MPFFPVPQSSMQSPSGVTAQHKFFLTSGISLHKCGRAEIWHGHAGFEQTDIQHVLTRVLQVCSVKSVLLSVRATK
jgi:hypothetical protein